MAAGWRATKQGWPDFFCLHPEKGIALIEVKPRASSPLKKSQVNIMRMLASFGVPCWRWDPVKGFERIRFDIEGTVEGARQGRGRGLALVPRGGKGKS